MNDREILFRGKRKDNGKWVYGGSLLQFAPDDSCYIAPSSEIVYIGEDDAGNITRLASDIPVIIPETVGQFTGLLDKNGTKIFEGDIVCHCNDNPYSDVEKGQVYWDEISCGWRRTSNGAFHNGKIDTYRMSPTCVYEIIGNIHGNPELMGSEVKHG